MRVSHFPRSVEDAACQSISTCSALLKSFFSMQRPRIYSPPLTSKSFLILLFTCFLGVWICMSLFLDCLWCSTDISLLILSKAVLHCFKYYFLVSSREVPNSLSRVVCSFLEATCLILHFCWAYTKHINVFRVLIPCFSKSVQKVFRFLFLFFFFYKILHTVCWI